MKRQSSIEETQLEESLDALDIQTNYLRTSLKKLHSNSPETQTLQRNEIISLSSMLLDQVGKRLTLDQGLLVSLFLGMWLYSKGLEQDSFLIFELYFIGFLAVVAAGLVTLAWSIWSISEETKS